MGTPFPTPSPQQPCQSTHSHTHTHTDRGEEEWTSNGLISILFFLCCRGCVTWTRGPCLFSPLFFFTRVKPFSSSVLMLVRLISDSSLDLSSPVVHSATHTTECLNDSNPLASDTSFLFLPSHPPRLPDLTAVCFLSWPSERDVRNQHLLRIAVSELECIKKGKRARREDGDADRGIERMGRDERQEKEIHINVTLVQRLQWCAIQSVFEFFSTLSLPSSFLSVTLYHQISGGSRMGLLIRDAVFYQREQKKRPAAKLLQHQKHSLAKVQSTHTD